MITLEARALARAMKHAAGIVDTRNTIPILSTVLLRTVDAVLELVTTNLDIELRQRIDPAATGDIACTVDARRLAALAGAVDQGAQITLAVEDKVLLVRAGRSRWRLPILPPEDFPVLPFEEPGAATLIDAAMLGAAIARTAPTVSTEPHRYYLNGTLFDIEGGQLRLASTNGHGLFAATIDVPLEEAPGLIVPPRFLAALRSLAEDGKVDLWFGDARLRARIGRAVLTGKAIDGTFPDYRRVIPPVCDNPVRFDPALMRAALRRVMVLAGSKTNGVKLTVHEDRIAISVTDPEAGTACEDVPAQCAAGHEAGFNGKYLNDMLDAIGGDTVELHHADPGAPALLRRVIDDGASGVLMPMRV